MANEDIREQMRRLNIPYWKIAELIGCSDGTLSRKMRSELSFEDRAKIEKAIGKLLSNENDDEVKYDNYEELRKKQRDISRQIDTLYYEIENLNIEHARICRILLHLQKSKITEKIRYLNNIDNKVNHNIPLEKKCEYCGKPVYAKNLCKTCYARFRRTGSVEPIQRKRIITKHVTDPRLREKERFADKWAETNSDLSIYEAYCRYGYCLLDRERNFIYYKLCKGYNNTEIAKMWFPHLSKERVRQIYNTIITKLNKQIVKETIKETAEMQQQEELLGYIKLYPKKDSWNEISIYDITTLPARAFNAITRSGVMTVGDYYDLMVSGKYKNLRNVGEKTVKVLIECLENFLKERK